MSDDKNPCPERRKLTGRELIGMISGIITMLAFGITILIFLQTQQSYAVAQEKRLAYIEKDVKSNKEITDLQSSHFIKALDEQKKSYDRLSEKVDTLIMIIRRMQ